VRGATVRLWLLHLLANALLIGGAYLWLGIRDATGLQLVETALFGLLLIALTVWLHGAVFAHFCQPESPLWPAFRSTLRHLLPLVLLAAVIVALYWLIEWLFDRYAYSRAAVTASWLTLHLRRPVRPAAILSIFTWKVRLIEWLVIPVVFLPLIAAVADVGWRGFAAKSFLILRRWWFWLACPILLVLAFYVPHRLVDWVPWQGKLGVEVTSFLLRWLVAWLLFITAWFAVVALACGRRPWPGHSPLRR